MTTPTWWLALDQGGHSSRAMVFDQRGQLIAQTAAPIETHTRGDQVEHDAAALLGSLQHCLRELAGQLQQDVQHLVAAGLATQRSSIVCWDQLTGAALSPVLSWQDRRQHFWLKQFEAQRSDIQRITGLVLSPHYGASKLRWCLEHLPAVMQAQTQQRLNMGPLSSYLLHGLLVERPHLVDPANASRTLLWSPTTRDWDHSLLSLFGVPHQPLPRCVPTHYLYGHLEVGGRQIPLRICTGDQAAVPFAHGALRSDCIYVNAGTGAFALAPLHGDVDDAAPLLRSVVWSDASNHVQVLEGTVNGAASALTWYGQTQQLDAATLLPTLNRQRVATHPPPVFINGIGGVGSPFWLPQVQSHFSNSNDSTAAWQQVAAIVESIAFLLAANIKLMQQHQPHLQHIVIGGGLSQCDYLCACLADLTSLQVQRLQERELTAKGLAFLVANQPDAWQTQLAATSATDIRHLFPPQLNPLLQQRQQIWRDCMARI